MSACKRSCCSAYSTLLLCGLACCAETGSERVEVPLFASGRQLDEEITTVGGHPLALERAELAFGPLYLCAGFQAGQLCETARLEWLDAQVLDLLDAEARQLGVLEGVTGQVASWMFDLGLSSQLTDNRPFVFDAARQLGGVSLRLSGRVLFDEIPLTVSAALALQQEESTELGVPILRKSSSERFLHEVEVGEAGLLVAFDVSAWARNLDFSEFQQTAACEAGGAARVCAGSLEQSCDEAGTLTATRDCTELGEACIKGLGCATELTLDEESAAFRSLRNAVFAGARPSFEWGFSPALR